MKVLMLNTALESHSVRKGAHARGWSTMAYLIHCTLTGKIAGHKMVLMREFIHI
jgi:hypothetical protein